MTHETFTLDLANSSVELQVVPSSVGNIVQLNFDSPSMTLDPDDADALAEWLSIRTTEVRADYNETGCLRE